MESQVLVAPLTSQCCVCGEGCHILNLETKELNQESLSSPFPSRKFHLLRISKNSTLFFVCLFAVVLTQTYVLPCFLLSCPCLALQCSIPEPAASSSYIASNIAVTSPGTADHRSWFHPLPRSDTLGSYPVHVVGLVVF